nr:CAP domain-containing protein [Lysinibacillus timonensis]
MKKIFPLLLVAILSLVLSITTSANMLSASDYVDFKEEQYWADEMIWAIDNGVLNGYPEERKIKPNKTLTEAQFLTMLLRLLNSDELETFINEYSGNSWTPQYEMAKKYNLSVSYENSLAWNKPIRRGTVAKLLAESLTGKEVTEVEAVQWMYDTGISDGQSDENGYFPKTYASYLPNATLTRAQVVVFLYNVSLNDHFVDNTIQGTEKEVYEISLNGIRINDHQNEVEAIYGQAKRISQNDNGLKIYTYYKNDYDDFLIVGYDANKRASFLYSNQNHIYTARFNGEELRNREMVTSYFKTSNSSSSTEVVVDENIITFYYDTHLVGTPVRALLLKKPNWKLTSTVNVFETNDYLIFDITNSYRNVYGLKPLQWDDQISQTAYKHSKDMYENEFFDHYNLQGESPFDRMMHDDIKYSYAGENIAYGYTNGIDATEAWMNSTSGHREAILDPDFTHLGVGSYYWYYTQNYYIPWD